MAVSFSGFDSLLSNLATLAALETQNNAHDILQQAAERIRDEAKSELGTYQGAVGPYPAWAKLADATIAERTRRPSPNGPEAPLLDTGQMREDIHVIEVTDKYADIGIAGGDQSRPYAAAQELGSVTKGIPPRPFLGPALWKEQETFVDKILEMVRARIKP